MTRFSDFVTKLIYKSGQSTFMALCSLREKRSLNKWSTGYIRWPSLANRASAGDSFRLEKDKMRIKHANFFQGFNLLLVFGGCRESCKVRIRELELLQACQYPPRVVFVQERHQIVFGVVRDVVDVFRGHFSQRFMGILGQKDEKLKNSEIFGNSTVVELNYAKL